MQLLVFHYQWYYLLKLVIIKLHLKFTIYSNSKSIYIKLL